jgi:hypothetical protein
MNNIEIQGAGVWFKPIGSWMLLVFPSNREIFYTGNLVPLDCAVGEDRAQDLIAQVPENVNQVRKILAA